MSDKSNRFLRLELFAKQKPDHSKQKRSRFERLEVDGHKIKIEIKDGSAHQEKKCPRCGAKIDKGKNHCKECLYVLNKPQTKKDKINPWSDLCADCGRVLNKTSKICEYCTPDPKTGKKLESWQAQCPGCQRVVNKTQGSCMYCGWQLTNQPKKESRSRKKETVSFISKSISVKVDGVRYHSTDQYLPPGIMNLMRQIDEKGYSKGLVNEWVRERKAQDEMFETMRQDSVDNRINSLRMTILWRVTLVIGSVLFFIFYFFLSRRR